MTTVIWFRRDLRTSDHPALLAACEEAADGVVALFVLDPNLWEPAGPARRAYLAASLRDLHERLDGRLVVRRGDPVEVVPKVVREVEAGAVHISADYAPYGARRDEAVEEALDVPLVRTGSPYAVAPGRVLTGDGAGYKVFTPFFRAWSEHGWRAPAGHRPPGVDWLELDGVAIPDAAPPEGLRLPAAGEPAARERWRGFLAERLAAYKSDRDRPDRDATSGMSVHLKWGEIHPRTLLADLSEVSSGLQDAAAKLRSEIAWREFYADVLHHQPHAARRNFREEFDRMEFEEPGEAFDAWQRGETGFPLVDAGMRELHATGTMHNRVRMLVASFLVKDLHVHWWHGSRHFMEWLIDGDLASNQLNWQWVAGSGTDAAPYFRVFNPETQARKFDPDGAYVRRWVPELEEPGYPEPIVDHAAERQEALDRWERIRR